MTQATVKTAFKGVPDGKQHGVVYVKGDTVTGNLAAVAITQGWADPVDGAEPKKKEVAAKPGRVLQPGRVSRRNKSTRLKRPASKQ